MDIEMYNMIANAAFIGALGWYCLAKGAERLLYFSIEGHFVRMNVIEHAGLVNLSTGQRRKRWTWSGSSKHTFNMVMSGLVYVAVGLMCTLFMLKVFIDHLF